MLNRKNKFSRSIVDAIDYQLDLLGYITETMWVSFRLRLHQQRYCSTVRCYVVSSAVVGKNKR
jgi:hypothetical protein